MKYIVKKNKPEKYWLRKIIIYAIGIISTLAMFIAGWGTSYTNYIPLLEIFHVKLLAIGMSITITLVFGLSSFIDNCPRIYRFINFLIVTISSYLAISTVSINSIKDHEIRIANDSESKQLFERYKALENQYNQTMQNYELAFIGGKFKGAQSYREQGEDLKRQAQEAFQQWQRRTDELKQKGSIQQEASIMAITAILPVSSQSVLIASKLILSIINDISFKFFSFLVSIIFHKYVTIYIHNKKHSKFAIFKQWCVSFISRRKNVKFVSTKIEFHKKAIKKAWIDNPYISYRKLGEIAANSVGRDRPFSKSFVCQALKS